MPAAFSDSHSDLSRPSSKGPNPSTCVGSVADLGGSPKPGPDGPQQPVPLAARHRSLEVDVEGAAIAASSHGIGRLLNALRQSANDYPRAV
jgi:hypothetical protein